MESFYYMYIYIKGKHTYKCNINLFYLFILNQIPFKTRIILSCGIETSICYNINIAAMR